ncbi:GMC family oxidoreductase [Spongiactinospora sp. 9N601]|uniref:GMC family oxidoreductase n=1 Tax=Spongiactinospora sp. 9N601 TaxID=3375149 RepID=UPI0037AB5B69
MARRNSLPKVDVVCVGVGWAGGIMAAELAKAGLTVVGLERGGPRGVEDFAHGHDELRYAVDRELMQNVAAETWTLRHDVNDRALPIRRLGSFAPAYGVGGSGVSWAGQTWRFNPRDFEIRSRTVARYGAGMIPADMTIQDWGITYDDLEPYYDKFEYMAGISGKAGNIKGAKVPGGNPFEGPRSRDFPLPPLIESYAGSVFREAAAKVGYQPFPGPAGALSKPYTNPDGMSRPGCTYCGFTGHFGCHIGAKSDPTLTVIPTAQKTGRFELRTNAQVIEILHDGGRATGVRYYDASGAVRDQPADVVVLTAFTLNNCRLLLLSKMGEPYDPATGEGVIGRNYCYQSDGAGAMAYFKDKDFKPYMVACGSAIAIDDLNGDNFDHTGLGFIGGGLIKVGSNPTTPINAVLAPPGTPAWGLEWKKAIRKHYAHSLIIGAQGESPAYRGHYLSLDPTYRDAYGLPLVRITFDWEPNERKMVAYLGEKLKEIATAMNPDSFVAGGVLAEHYDGTQYQSTHNTGGVIMGADPRTSAVNNYLQMWDFPNTFVVGASAFPQNAGYNPTGTVGALAYRAVDGVLRYRDNPGPLA